MTSGQETERVHSHNPGAHTGPPTACYKQKLLDVRKTLFKLWQITAHFLFSSSSSRNWLQSCRCTEVSARSGWVARPRWAESVVDAPDVDSSSGPSTCTPPVNVVNTRHLGHLASVISLIDDQGTDMSTILCGIKPRFIIIKK